MQGESLTTLTCLLARSQITRPPLFRSFLSPGWRFRLIPRPSTPHKDEGLVRFEGTSVPLVPLSGLLHSPNLRCSCRKSVSISPFSLWSFGGDPYLGDPASLHPKRVSSALQDRTWCKMENAQWPPTYLSYSLHLSLAQV